VINGDGDFLSGLVVDKLGDTLSIEVSSIAVMRRLPRWIKILHEALGTKKEIVQVDDHVARVEGIEPIGVHLLHVEGTEHRACAYRGHALRARRRQFDLRDRLAELDHSRAALAASASAGAPLTHRGAAQSVTFVTGHAAGEGDPDLDWPALARANHTVVIYMGASTAGRIAGRLIAAGRSASTPALVVFRASQPDERRVSVRLGDLAAAAASDTGPALLLIGEAMAGAVASLPDLPAVREERA
jgi:hypothetical protein